MNQGVCFNTQTLARERLAQHLEHVLSRQRSERDAEGFEWNACSVVKSVANNSASLIALTIAKVLLVRKLLQRVQNYSGMMAYAGIVL